MTKKQIKIDPEILDVEFLQTITDGDIEFEKELFDTFIDSCGNNIDKMRDAVKNRDNDAWRMASHSFKGASASIGAFDLSHTLETAQTFSEEDYKGKADILNKVEKKFHQVVEYLKIRLDK